MSRRPARPVAHAIGFEGVVFSPDRLPAILAAVVVDAARYRLVARDGQFRRLSTQPLADMLPPTATAIDPPVEASPGDAFLVLSTADCAIWRSASARGLLFSPESVRDFTRIFGRGYVAVLLSEAAERRVLGPLRDVASIALRKVVREAVHEATGEPDPRLYELAWRLARCAVSDADAFRAVAAMKLSPHPDRADHLLSAYFPKLGAEERLTQLARAHSWLTESGAS